MELNDCAFKSKCSVTARIIWQNLDNVERIFRPRVIIDGITTVEYTADVVIPAGRMVEVVMNI